MNNFEESNALIALFLGATEDYWEAQNQFNVRLLTDEDDAWEEGEQPIWIDCDTGEEAEDSLYLNFEEVSDEYLPPLEDYSDWVIPVEELRYHESWDWLIPVVQKINLIDIYSIAISGVEVGVFKLINNLYWQQIKGNYPFTIEGIYQAVVETIKLINNEKI